VYLHWNSLWPPNVHGQRPEGEQREAPGPLHRFVRRRVLSVISHGTSPLGDRPELPNTEPSAGVLGTAR
jgi:hypothetical protein